MIKDGKNFFAFLVGDKTCVYAPRTQEMFFFLNTVDSDTVEMFISSKEDKKRKNLEDSLISTVYLFLTSKCNFACKYCFEKETLPMSEETMKKEDIPKIISFLESFKFSDKFRIFLYGGEPLLDFNLLQYIVNSIKNSPKLTVCGLTICTNGSIYSSEISNFIRKNNIYLSISLDGSKIMNTERININGNNTYDSVIRNIKKFKEDKINISISCTIHKSNIDYLPQIPVILKPLGVKSIGFSYPIGDRNFNIDYLSYQLFKSYEVCRSIKLHEDFMVKRIKPLVSKESFLSECNAPGKQLVIFPDLTVSPCVAYKSKLSITTKNISNELFKNWQNAIPINNQNCKKCVLINICGGGCLINRKDINVPCANQCALTINTIKSVLKRQLNKNIKLVIMDYDDTIVLRDVGSALNSAANVLLPDNHEKIMNFFENEIKGFFDPKLIITVAGKKFGVSYDLINNAIDAYFCTFDKGIVKKETIDLLRYLKKKYGRIVILSGNDKKHLKHELENFKILSYFSEIYCVNPAEKNTVKPYENVLISEKKSSCEVLYIGDTFEEIKFAEKLGMKTILVKYGVIPQLEWIKYLV